jgi:hypothetical protein
MDFKRIKVMITLSARLQFNKITLMNKGCSNHGDDRTREKNCCEK